MPPEKDPVGTISVAERDDATIASLAGEIDLEVKVAADAALARLVTRELPMVIDVSRVTFLGSTGIAFLASCSRAALRQGVPVSIVRPPRSVWYVLDVLGMSTFFDVVDGVDTGGPEKATG